MDRFTAYLLVRRLLKRPESRNQALAVEAIMEDLGRRKGEPAEPWGVLGLLSQLDLEYIEQNPRIRGRMAREQAEIEGLPPARGQHLERWCQHVRPETDPRGELAVVEQALLAATILAEELLARERVDSDETVSSLARELELLRGRGDSRGDALDRAVETLELTNLEAARVAVDALQRIAQDLR